jgi:hypothetical protein
MQMEANTKDIKCEANMHGQLAMTNAMERDIRDMLANQIFVAKQDLEVFEWNACRVRQDCGVVVK